MVSSRTIDFLSDANQGIRPEIPKNFNTENIILRDAVPYQRVKPPSLPSPNPAIKAIELDISCDSSVSKAFGTIDEKFGQQDVLINNAGIWKGMSPKSLKTRQRHAAFTETFVPLLCESSQPFIVCST